MASKHAVDGFTRAIAIDCAPHGIRCNSVNMCATETPMLERAMAFVKSHRAAEEPGARRPAIKTASLIGRVSTAWEQAAVMLFLASRDARYLAGALVASDGGWTAYRGDGAGSEDACCWPADRRRFEHDPARCIAGGRVGGDALQIDAPRIEVDAIRHADFEATHRRPCESAALDSP